MPQESSSTAKTNSRLQRSTRWLLWVSAIGLFLVVIVIMLTSFDITVVNFVPFKALLFIHILGAILFLGNIIITGIWMGLAEASHSSEVKRFAVRTVNWQDVFFTSPGVSLILIGGISMAQVVGYGNRWLMLSIVLFGLSGVVWLALLIPHQDKLVKLANTPTGLGKAFHAALHRWYFWGIVATILPLAVLALMISRPAL